MRHVLTALFCFSLAVSLRAETAPLAAFEVDFSEVPEMKEWATTLQQKLHEFFPVIEEKFGKENVRRQVKIAIKKDVKGSGFTQGFNIVLGAAHFQGKPEDFGTAVFYLTRVMQSYKAKNAPNWLVTGIADYMRWWNYEPVERRRNPNPRDSKYTNGFNDMASFLVWIEKTHDKELVRKLNESLFTDTYNNDVFKKLTGKEVSELWNDFVTNIRNEAEHVLRKAVDPTIKKPAPKEFSIAFTDIGAVEFQQPENGLAIRYTLDGSFPTVKSAAYCGAIKVASSLTLRAATFDKDGKYSDTVDVACTCEPGEKKEQNAKAVAAINVDFSEVPDLKDWALKAQRESEDYYAVIAEKLRSDGFTPSRQITLVFTEGIEGLGPGVPAFAIPAQSKVYFRAGHIRANPNDFGMVIHEVTHVVQHYTHGGNRPSWLVEGIADYVRWENWEKPAARRRINPLKAKYTNGYSDTARFLSWVEKSHDKDLVLKLNAALRQNTYNDELFKTYSGKDLSALWNDFLESLPK